MFCSSVPKTINVGRLVLRLGFRRSFVLVHDMESDRIFQFADFSLDPGRLELRRDGTVVPLKPRHCDALLFFVKSGGRFLSKEELIEALWPNTIVEENNLAQCVSVLRKALGNGEGNQRFIETVPGRGYRFVTAVREVSREEPDRKAVVSSTPARSSRRWLMAGSILLVLIAAVGLVFWRRPDTPAPPAGIPTVAVMPLVALEPGNAPPDFGLMIADALINRLSSWRVVTVRPTAMIRPYVDDETDPTGTDPIKFGRDLKADAVIEGWYRHQGDTVIVSFYLMDVQTADGVWSLRVQSAAGPDAPGQLTEQASGLLMRELMFRKDARHVPAAIPLRAIGLGAPPSIPFTIVVADTSAFGGTGGLIEIDPASGGQTKIASGGYFVEPTGVTLDQAGDFLVADEAALDGTGAIIRVHFDRTDRVWKQSIISKGGVFRDPFTVELDRDGSLIVVDHVGQNNHRGRVVRVDPATGAQTVISEGQFFHTPSGVAIDAEGRYIVTDCVGMMGPPSQVLLVDPRKPKDANQSVISSSGQLEDPIDVAFDAVGRLFVIDSNTPRQPNSPGQLFIIDTKTGAQRRISAGGLLQQPTNFRFAPTGDLFVSDYQVVAIIRVDPVTGAQQAISSGGMLVAPRGMAILTRDNFVRANPASQGPR